MMSAQYKPSLRTRRCYIYIWLRSILIAGKRLVSVLSDWKNCKPKRKFIQLKRFLAVSAQNLVRTVPPVGRPLLEEFQSPQKKSSSGSRKFDKRCWKRWLLAHANLQWKKGSVVYIVRYRFPILPAKDEMFGFV